MEITLKYFGCPVGGIYPEGLWAGRWGWGEKHLNYVYIIERSLCGVRRVGWRAEEHDWRWASKRHEPVQVW